MMSKTLRKILAEVCRPRYPKNCWQTTDIGQKNVPKNTRLTSIKLRLLKYPTVTSTNLSQYQQDFVNAKIVPEEDCSLLLFIRITIRIQSQNKYFWGIYTKKNNNNKQ